MKQTILFSILAAGPIWASAHPGHGTFDGVNLMHYVTSPTHVGLLALALGAIYLLSKYKRAQKR